MQYKIVDVTEAVSLAGNRVQRQYRVSVSVGEGRASFTLTVDESDLDPAKLKAKVEERVKAFEQVLDLGS